MAIEEVILKKGRKFEYFPKDNIGNAWSKLALIKPDGNYDESELNNIESTIIKFDQINVNGYYIYAVRTIEYTPKEVIVEKEGKFEYFDDIIDAWVIGLENKRGDLGLTKLKNDIKHVWLKSLRITRDDDRHMKVKVPIEGKKEYYIYCVRNGFLRYLQENPPRTKNGEGVVQCLGTIVSDTFYFKNKGKRFDKNFYQIFNDKNEYSSYKEKLEGDPKEGGVGKSRAGDYIRNLDLLLKYLKENFAGIMINKKSNILKPSETETKKKAKTQQPKKNLPSNKDEPVPNDPRKGIKTIHIKNSREINNSKNDNSISTKKDNLATLNEAFREILPCLAHFIGETLREKDNKNWWRKYVITKLQNSPDNLPSNGSYADCIKSLDIQACLTIIKVHWDHAFKEKFKRKDFPPDDYLTWARLLKNTRNNYDAHYTIKTLESFNDEKLNHALESMAVFMDPIDKDISEKIRSMKSDR